MGCLGYTEAYLKSRGMYVKRHEFNGFPSLVATTRRTRKPKLLLQAHLDVVAAPDSCFKLKKKGGKLLGRGSLDMKFAAASFLKIADDLRDRLSDYDFGIMFTSDEEIGGENGVKALLDEGYGAKVCLLPDAGKNWKLEISHKGCWIGRARASGSAAHGSKPWEGDNAIYHLVETLDGIKRLFDGQHEHSDTLSINMIAGGAAVNQVADSAEAVLDLRFIDERSYKRLHKQMSAIAGKHGVTLETVRLIKVSTTDVGHPLVLPFTRIVEEVHGKSMDRVRSLGISDAHFFSEHDIPVILTRPAGGCTHGDGEWIDGKDFRKFYEVVKAYVKEVAAQA
jgi:succinyl-diaminopimelate desuccinylase